MPRRRHHAPVSRERHERENQLLHALRARTAYAMERQANAVLKALRKMHAYDQRLDQDAMAIAGEDYTDRFQVCFDSLTHKDLTFASLIEEFEAIKAEATAAMAIIPSSSSTTSPPMIAAKATMMMMMTVGTQTEPALDHQKKEDGARGSKNNINHHNKEEDANQTESEADHQEVIIIIDQDNDNDENAVASRF